MTITIIPMVITKPIRQQQNGRRRAHHEPAALYGGLPNGKPAFHLTAGSAATPASMKVSVDIGVVRVRQTCGCGRPFIASDFTITGDDVITITATCGRCHDRPLEIELRIGPDDDEPDEGTL